MRSGRLSGSLTNLNDGTSYLIAGSNITVTSQSNGSIVVASTATGGSGGGDPGASYLVIGLTASLSNERVLTAGTGISFADTGANGSLTVSQTVPFTSASHAGMRQLVHLAADGPFETFTLGLVCDTGPSPFPTASIWYTDSSRTKKVVDQIVVYNSNKTVSSSQMRVYAEDGSTVVATALDTVTYSTVFETSRTRVIS